MVRKNAMSAFVSLSDIGHPMIGEAETIADHVC
jgi:hypothetical protein